MMAIYVVAALFMGWLAVMLYRVWRVAITCRGAGGGDGVSRRLAVLVQDQADGVEGLVYRLVADLQRRPGLRVTLVDGGSADETGLILERLARRYNMEFHRLAGVGSCLHETVAAPGAAHNSLDCLDLRGMTSGDLLKFNLAVMKSG